MVREPFISLIEALASRGVRFVIIGVSAANYSSERQYSVLK